MASKTSRNSQEWPLGSIVNFKDKSTGERFQGTVYYFTPKPQGSEMGIKNVTVWRVDGRCERQGYHHCNLNDIRDDQDNNGDDGSSSKSIEGKMESLRLDPPSK
ncbi:unnamed protein product [Arabis nemorensis]|uniref:BAH domain-containing protein n=1 Tax=Arabis nemorensis TaxID=586526 RepID=A0A565AV10_9BRAS|nr:unnamed protein product [Arabis nemorensis]